MLQNSNPIQFIISPFRGGLLNYRYLTILARWCQARLVQLLINRLLTLWFWLFLSLIWPNNSKANQTCTYVDKTHYNLNHHSPNLPIILSQSSPTLSSSILCEPAKAQ